MEINNDRILILSPHTDDAELGCAGTICRFIEEKKKIFWIVFSTAEDSLPESFPKDSLRNEFLEVITELDIDRKNIEIYNFRVRYLNESRQDVLEILYKINKEFKPELVIGPSINDYHQDHQVVANEMIRAFKTSASIICYELPWNHVKFETQLFVKLEERHVERKANILNLYKSQFIRKRHYFSKEYLYSLAITRGSQVDHRYAEAFEVIRWIF